MKSVYTSWNLNQLAETMIEKIMQNWTTPFNSPAVVFPDPKTEQWFKLHWLKRKVAGNSILMNLKTLRIQQFLFDLVTPENCETEKLSVELLRDIIITKLTSKTTDKNYYFRSLGDPQVTTYLTDKSSPEKINANHLYDFAQTIASLFLDYEDTRPDTLEKVLSLSPWQKKLYDDVIGESGVEIENKKYLTLYQLVKLNKKENGGALRFNWNKETPVFIFGFTGLGQIYRNILEDFSKDYSLEVFLQFTEIPEKPANQLLSKWGDFGREQLALWSTNCSAKAISEDQVFNKTDSLLHRIQNSIVQDNEIAAEAYNAADTSLTLTGAPTRLREIEVVHSNICKLLSKNDNTQLGDILVVAPKIQDYRTAIEQVFDQNDLFSADSNFPYIPYTIADYSGERSLTAEALNILFGILKKHYLSRSDVFALLHNYLVQTVRDFSDEDVSNWADWSSKLNIYRDRNGHEEWQKAKNRLLLARLTSDLVETNECKFLPFETMTTADNNSLYKFIQIIDELVEWESYSQKEKLDISDINRLEELLKSWLLLDDNIPENLYNESLVFQNVVEEIERQRLTASPDVFTDCFANALFDRSAAVTLHSANILTQGITFANFESNRILSAKYVFFLGLDSKFFPGVDNENELDLRGSKDKRQPGDESIPDRNKNAFLCQLMAAGEGLFFSYVNKNLQKDEEYFKSSVLEDLFKSVYDSSFTENNIKIDEDRPWNELYTQREYRNKHNFIALQSSKDSQDSLSSQTQTDAPQEAATLPDRITISQMKKFLNEPFIFYVYQKLTNNYDDEEKEQLEFEPLFLNNKVNSEIRKEYVISQLQGKNDITPEKISLTLSILNSLPDSYFGTAAVETVFENAKTILEKITSECPFAGSLIFNENKMHHIPQLSGITPKDWYISGELAWYDKNYTDTKIINTLELSGSNNVISGYITSLLLLAAQPDNDKNVYDINLHVLVFTQDTASIPEPENFKATPADARSILNEIYKAMFIDQYKKSVPLSLIQEEFKGVYKKQFIFSFNQFKDKLQSDYGHTEWTYFSKKKLFDLDSDLGYTDETFDAKWSKAKKHQKQLIKYLKIFDGAGE